MNPIYVVLRESADGLEADCFKSEAAASQWAEHCGAEVRAEHLLDLELPRLIASREAA